MPLAPQRTLDLGPHTEYKQPYVTGTTARIYAGAVWVAEASNLTWDYTNQKGPVYGYASRYFDAVAQGTIIVNGNFMVAYREEGYLTDLLNIAIDRYSLSAVRELAKRRGDIGSYEPGENVGVGLSLADIVDRMKEDGGWEDVLNELQRTVWDSSRPVYPTPDLVEISPSGKVLTPSFNLVVQLGVGSRPDPIVKVLEDVHITGSRMVVGPTGEPIQEGYSFFAKTMYEGTSKDPGKTQRHIFNHNNTFAEKISREEVRRALDDADAEARIDRVGTRVFVVFTWPEDYQMSTPDYDLVKPAANISLSLSNKGDRTMTYEVVTDASANPRAASTFKFTYRLSKNGLSSDLKTKTVRVSPGRAPQ